MALFDLIQQNLNKANQPKPQASEMNQTGQVQQLLAAKQGKAVGGPAATPRLSNIGEQQAQAQTALQQQQVGAEAQAAGVQIGQQVQGQQQAIQQQQAEVTEKEESQQDAFNRNHQAILDQYTQGKATLDLNKDKSKFEQIGINLRLQNSQYIDKLQREGARARLDNATKFREEMARSMFAEEESMFRDDMNFRNMIAGDQRSFNDDLANVDLDFAMKMSMQDNAAANQRMMWTGVGGGVSGGSQIYGKSGSKQGEGDLSDEDVGGLTPAEESEMGG